MSSLLNATSDLVGVGARRCTTPLPVPRAEEPRCRQASSQAIREGVKLLGRQPGMGRPAQNLEPEYREQMIDFGNSGYVALYRYDGRTAVILAVRHQRELDSP